MVLIDEKKTISIEEKASIVGKTAIMGFGNPCRSDDGIAIYVIDELKQLVSEDNDSFTLFDMGTSAFEVLFQLQGHHRIIIVDAVINTGEPAGTIYKLPASEINAQIQDDPMVFLHSLKWDQALSYAKKILREAYPEDIEVYLIAVNNTKLDIQLSEEVKRAGDKVIELLKDDILGISRKK
ncbi:hydrogenase maturation protease [Emticicia oligotrophica DSM 17448]|uniref:Hydrogenase maturation protease n=1 Tax=Emticicia oligotrophica (strain DSM 17448 / CIP 109782 / MTCC 6937 / GPTSA100-15) TaxID=929562 RepID=A0ABM5N3E2_EMTOG|nr:hydrogenase maturation protease [Emticicia oligotrophica]AFK03951.1 hydrogenase maturation protease [Emticicia oligotrophica DSM 17448]